jgi:hypothetical protein
METHLCDGKVMSCQIPWYSMWKKPLQSLSGHWTIAMENDDRK